MFFRRENMSEVTLQVSEKNLGPLPKIDILDFIAQKI
jgi:hypothetical protein